MASPFLDTLHNTPTDSTIMETEVPLNKKRTKHLQASRNQLRDRKRDRKLRSRLTTCYYLILFNVKTKWAETRINKGVQLIFTSWASQIRTGDCRSQSPVPYRLAMAQSLRTSARAVSCPLSELFHHIIESPSLQAPRAALNTIFPESAAGR